MKNKKILFILAILILISFIIYFVVFKKDEQTSKTEKNDLEVFENEVVDFTETVVEDGITKTELEEITSQEGGTLFIVTGSSSYVRQKSDSKGADVSKYEEAQDKYASALESKIKENFEYVIDSKDITVEKNKLITVTLKSYYYSLYVDDLNALAGKLLVLKGYNPSVDFLGNETDESKAEMYKAKIKAMEILNDYLDEYYNDYEYVSVDIVSSDSTKDTGQEYMNYLQAISGIKYKNAAVKMGVEPYLQKQEERINKYIEEAKENGVLDVNNPLELNA